MGIARIAGAAAVMAMVAAPVAAQSRAPARVAVGKVDVAAARSVRAGTPAKKNNELAALGIGSLLFAGIATAVVVVVVVVATGNNSSPG